MDRTNEQSYQAAIYKADANQSPTGVIRDRLSNDMTNATPNPDEENSEILTQMRNKHLLIVNSRRRNGLILYKSYHAEFAGPGSAVGGLFDVDCKQVLPVGNLSLVSPESAQERQNAYLIRRQWIRLTRQITDNPVPLQRAQKIIEQFKQFFGTETIAQIPDDALALLVGVLPDTISRAREIDD